MKEIANSYDVIVIGGGASGMMAAGTAAHRGKRVLLIEKNKKLGLKLSISGGSRCNILNAEEDEHTLLAKYGDARKFLYSAFAQFGMKDAKSFFESRKLPLTTEAGKRAFPHSQKAADVVKTLIAYMQEGGVHVLAGVGPAQLEYSGKSILGVSVGKESFTARSYIVATGGFSHPETGSTGDGFTWLSKLAHFVAKPNPTLVPLRIAETWIKKLSGTSLSDVKLTFYVHGAKKFSLRGRVLCTHFGLSGPLILNAAGTISDLLHEGAVTARIDLKPLLDLGSLDRELVALFDANKNKNLKNVFKNICPPGSSDSLLSLVPQIDPLMKVHSITKAERRLLAELLKAAPATIEGLMGYDRAVVADGGLQLSEVDFKEMRSKKIKNLFITGDLLNIRRPSGGFSLQLCWTTGFVAGSHA